LCTSLSQDTTAHVNSDPEQVRDQRSPPTTRQAAELLNTSSCF